MNRLPDSNEQVANFILVYKTKLLLCALSLTIAIVTISVVSTSNDSPMSSELVAMSERPHFSQSETTESALNTTKEIRITNTTEVEKTSTETTEEMTTTTLITVKPVIYKKITVYKYNSFGSPSKTFEMVDSECFTLPEDWDKMAASINTYGECFEIFRYKKCNGLGFQLKPGTPGHARLRDINFDKRISSLRPCSSDPRNSQIKYRSGVKNHL